MKSDKRIGASIFFCYYLLLNINICIAQSTGISSQYDFVPREHIVFDAKQFPKDKYSKLPSDKRYSKTNYWKIEKIKDQYALLIGKGLECWQGPEQPDSFTFEFDFAFIKHSSLAIVLTSEMKNGSFFCIPDTGAFTLLSYNAQNFGFINHIDSGAFYYLGKGPEFTKIVGINHAEKQDTAWHHFALSYNKWGCYYYLDKCRIQGNLFHCKVNGIDSTNVIYGIVYDAAGVNIKNLKIATGKKTEPFYKILTEKKFVTHAIHFDVNKSTIKPESTPFMMQLAEFLKANPALKLEIGGYTDSDGDTGANMKLSEQRADQVKKQLTALGIDAQRLIAKGYGASKPIQPNNTTEGKAMNRRVEFVKL